MKKILTIRIFILVIAVLFIFPSFAAETCRKFVATDNSGMKFVIELTFSDERTAGFDAVIYKKSQPSNKIYGYGIGALEDTRKSMYFDSGLFRILFPKGPLTKLGLETILYMFQNGDKLYIAARNSKDPGLRIPCVEVKQ